MKKHYILLSVLAVLCALTLVSCRGLASAHIKTGDFTFTIDSEMAAGIARSANDSEITVKVTVKSTDGSSYTPNPQIKKASSVLHSENELKAALTGMTFEFTDVPLNIEMSLKVEIKIDGDPYYSSLTQKFKLTETGATTIEAFIYADLHTPIVLKNSSSDYYYRYTSPEHLPKNYNGNLDIDDDYKVTNSGYYYCVDNEGTLYTADNNEINAYFMDGNEDLFGITFDDYIGETFIFDICYDPIKNKVVVVIFDPTDSDGYIGDTYCYQFTPDTFPVEEDLHLTPSTKGVTKLAKGIFFDTYTYYSTSCLYAYNGRLYSLLTYDSSYIDEDSFTSPSVTLRVQSLNDGKLIKDSKITIPDVHSQAEESDYIFNDIYVDESGIYILFHQYEMWKNIINNNTLNLYDEELSGLTASENGFIDRGGIIIADYETFAQKKTVGMPTVNTSLTVPLITDVYAEGNYYYPKLFADAAHTKEKTVTIPVTYSVANEGKGELANPQKIVGILPKKLIIADGGTFLYTNELDFTVETGDKAGVYALNNKDKITSDTATRLVEIDLETFSAKVVASIDDYNFYESTLNSGFRVEYEQHIPERNTSYYSYETEFVENFYDTTSGVKYLDNTSCQYNNGSYHAIANIVFGEAGV